MRRFLPNSLLGQMLLSVALALLVAQTISAVLQYRVYEQRREMIAAHGLAFQLVTEPRFDFRSPDLRNRGGSNRGRWQRLQVERTTEHPLQSDEVRHAKREDLLRSILREQGVEPAEVVVVTRQIDDDDYVMDQLRGQERVDWARGRMLVAGLLRQGESEWTVARYPLSEREPDQLGELIGQTLLLYVVLVGGLALLLRRITRPLAALTRRVEHFAATREIDGQLEPSGPDDTRRRISALLNEKDVMLGAIGHDLKTPLAALRVRIESVEDSTERERMAASIDDISRSLDDILSLARVGRSTDPLEVTDLSALVGAVVEEFEDMGEAVTLADTVRIALPIRATWLRRALRNLIGNALRYGEHATISLRKEGDEAVVRVEDQGPGIPQAELGRMLEPFTRGEGSRNRTTGGAGLGLTIAKAIAEQHGGRLVLANRPEGGLSVELRLPTSR
jgi:signal transduction histidine kinase